MAIDLTGVNSDSFRVVDLAYIQHNPSSHSRIPSQENDVWENIQNELDVAEVIHISENDVPVSRLIDISVANDDVIPDHFQNPRVTPTLLEVADSPGSDADTRMNGDSMRPRSRNLEECYVLQKEVDGFMYNSKSAINIKKLARGTILVPLSSADYNIQEALKKYARGAADLILVDILDRFTFAIAGPTDVMTITYNQTMLLISVQSAEDRFRLHKDFERFHFIENLKPGDLVSVDISESRSNVNLVRGKIVAISSSPKHFGHCFEVSVMPYGMNGHDYTTSSRPLYANAAQLSKPTWNTVARYDPKPQAVESRNIPIRRLDRSINDKHNSIQINGTSDAFARDLHNWDGDSRKLVDPTLEWRERPYEERERRLPRGRPTQMPSNLNNKSTAQPSRSQSAHVVAGYDRTVCVDDPSKTNGFRLNDRCMWTEGNRAHKATIRFLGHLKGHSNLYAGLEFDDAVGKGTGMFQGEVVFTSPENRAGFVLVSTLERLPTPKTKSSNSEGVTILNIRHKQASAESLSDPPSNAPSIPPRPAMRPEDFLINSFAINDYVEVCHLGYCRSGVVRWLGDAVSEDNDHIEKSAVVELDEDIPPCWRLAPSSSSMVVPRGVLVPTTALRRDRRVGSEKSDEQNSPPDRRFKTADFGSIDSGIEVIRCEPWKIAEDLVGRMKGIQGHKNSCYLDATLYAMFVQSTSFDYLLERPQHRNDVPQYGEFLSLLATEIVYPLRKFHYVRADHVMKLRNLLSELIPQMKGLTSEEKDPEEILGEIFKNILKAQPLLELINLKDKKVDRTYLCPLIVEDWQTGVATTQHLLERSMRGAGVRFVSPPKNLILQLPRYGQQKVFDKILPLEKIDITGLVNNAVQQCFTCSKPAEGMCPECYLCKSVFLTEVSFCNSCFKKAHFNTGEMDHIMRDFYPSGKPVKKPNCYRMTLSAVLCIETSHYVAYVRHAASGKWLFFDSMADREGFSEGFNVPQVKECDRMAWWLSSFGWDKLKSADQVGYTKTMLGKGSDVDPLVTRLLSDSYICFYQEENLPPSTSNNLLANVLQKMKI